VTIDLSPIVGAWPFRAKALGVTVLVNLASMLLGVVLGLLVGAGRVYDGHTLDSILGFYVDSMRAVPVLVPEAAGLGIGLDWPAVEAATIDRLEVRA
jgi:ABC-type amino acid transport system permease subunit